MLLGTLKMYVQNDVWTAVSNDTMFLTVENKWNKLKRIYRGVSQMSTFNVWVSLTGTALDEAQPMLLQIQKLNDARAQLSKNKMEIPNLQFCFILLKALPESYSTVASAILASRDTSTLKLLIIQEQILNKESRRARSTASLNKVAPIKNKSNKKNIKCYYCQESGHKSNEFQKKKQDAEEKEKKEKEAGANKVVNAHMLVLSMARIMEIPENEDNIHVSLYAATCLKWLVDSSATHHISPVHSDFVQYTLTLGVVSLGGHTEIRQTGIGTINIWA